MSQTMQLSQDRPLLLMLDYDGTLTPITPHIDHAQITEDRLSFLRRVIHLSQVLTAIVSGRSIPQQMMFLHSLQGEPTFLSGLHGGILYDMANQSDIVAPSDQYTHQAALFKAELIRHGVETLPGIILEDKTYSIGLHYRMADDGIAQKAVKIFDNAFVQLNMAPLFALRYGKQAMEAVPAGFHKGLAVEQLLEQALKRFGEKPALLYIGDDITDFDAFRAVTAHGGRTVYVGAALPPEAPAVDIILPDVDAVYRFLEDILAADLKATA